LLVPGETLFSAGQQQQQTPQATPTTQAGQQAGQQPAADQAKLPNDQLDSLVAPIALYPDPLLTQTLVASTYPLELVQLHQWLGQNKNLKDKALTEAVEKQDWDPSIQAMAQFPDLVKQLAENIKWTTDLGNAFLAQQNDVMDAVQRMRAKAQEKGNLKTTKEQKVETKTVENKSVIVIEQASPEVVYVPSYNPVVVYGAAPVYAYPPIYYPPPGYYAAGMAISFGVGMAMGAAWGGGWGWNTGWGGHNDVTINRNNTFVNNSNRQNYNRQGVNGAGARGNTWQHNPQHRGGAPYPNRATASQFNGTARGDSLSSRQANARQNVSANRSSTGGSLPQSSRGSAGGGGDRVGNRSTSSGAANARGSGTFGGSGGGTNAAASRASSARGQSSFSGGGGARAGGGMRGGGGRRGR